MSDKQNEGSFSKASKSYSRERQGGREAGKPRSDPGSERSERSAKSASKRSANSPPEHRASPSLERKKLLKLPVYVVVDGAYAEKLERDRFELLERIKAKFGVETMRVDDSIVVPELKGRIVSVFAAVDDDKYDAVKYFASKYLRASEEHDNSSANAQLRLLMPESVVSLFIGAKGKHIKQLMYDTRTKIVVSQPGQPAQYRALSIQGDAHYVKGSLRTVASTIERLATDKQFSGSEAKLRPVENRSARVLAKIVIDDGIITYLYGKRDNIMRSITKDHNVGLKVVEPMRNLNLGREDRICVS